MINITEYIFDDDLQKILIEHCRLLNVSFAVRPNDKNGDLIGSKTLENALNLVEKPLTADGKFCGALYGFSDECSSEIVDKAVLILKANLEERLAREMEIENLSMEITNNYEELNQMLENNNLFADALTIEQVIPITLERALEVSKSTISSIMLLDDNKETMRLRGRHGGRAGTMDDAGMTVKGSIWEKVVVDLQPLLIEDVRNREEMDSRLYEEMDFESFASGTFLSVPLKIKEDAIGVLNVGDKTEGYFTAPDIKFLSSLASQSASSIEKARLYRNIENEARLRSNFQRYLSPAIVDDIVKGGRDLTLGGEEVESSILFSDICGFTALTEKEKPETIIRLLNEYFSVMTEIIFRNNGTLDKFIGDSIMAIFGAPIPSPVSHLNAVVAAIEMQQSLVRLRAKWEAEGLPVFRQRIGINTGWVVAGNIGSPDRMDYTVIGDVVNLASRMESNAKPMTTLISQYTYEKVKENVKVRPLEAIRVKGKTEVIRPYEILAIKPPVGDGDYERVNTRYEVAFVSKITEENDSSKVSVGTVMNISIGGLLMATPEKFSEGKWLIMEMPMGLSGEELIFRGEVTYAQRIEDKIGSVYYNLGVRFDDATWNRHEEVLKALTAG
jgi:adenylate cyclase